MTTATEIKVEQSILKDGWIVIEYRPDGFLVLGVYAWRDTAEKHAERWRNEVSVD